MNLTLKTLEENLRRQKQLTIKSRIILILIEEINRLREELLRSARDRSAF